MPLEHGRSKATFSRNVAEMIGAGHPRAQSLAAAYRQQRAPLATGGAVKETTMEKQDSHIKGIGGLPKHKEDRPAGPVPMRHLNRLGVLSQDSPNGVGKPSTESRLANQGRKNW